MSKAVTDSIHTENVVVSSGIGQELDLQSLAMDLAGADYDPEQFPGLVYRSDDPRATTLIFRSGKLVCTGAKSIDGAETAVENVIERLEELNINVETEPITVQNVVSSGDLDKGLNLNAIAIGLGLENVEYEPEQFPGLVYRLDDPKSVVLLFGSGKCVITGTKSEEAAIHALDQIADRLDTLGLL